MKHNVDITVVQPDKKGAEDVGYSLQGRLLGACNEMDATRVVLNWPVTERVLTGGTSSLEESVKVMKEIHQEDNEKGFGHLMVAISAIGKMEHSEILETLTKQLFVTPPVVLFAEEPNKESKKPFSISLDCADGSIITMEECEDA